jgi:PEP-CTERM motif
MDYSKFKILFCVAVSLTMLLAPFALDITPDGTAQAFSSRSGNKRHFQSEKNSAKKPKPSWVKNEFHKKGQNGPISAPHPVPEPATMLLVGGGLAGLAIFRRKFKK